MINTEEKYLVKQLKTSSINDSRRLNRRNKSPQAGRQSEPLWHDRKVLKGNVYLTLFGFYNVLVTSLVAMKGNIVISSKYGWTGGKEWPIWVL